jgi:hypothetical protein
MALLPEWSPVKVAIRRLSDLPSLSAFLAGGTVVQGVTMAIGDRFLLFGEPNGNENGIFQLYGGDDWIRPDDADAEADYVTGKQLQVVAGDYAGVWRYVNPVFPGFQVYGQPAAPAFDFRFIWPAPRRVDAFAVPGSLVPVPVILLPADDNRAPQPWAQVVPKALNPFQPQPGPTSLGVEFTSTAPAPVNFGFPTRLTILGNELEIAGSALVVRL